MCLFMCVCVQTLAFLHKRGPWLWSRRACACTSAHVVYVCSYSSMCLIVMCMCVSLCMLIMHARVPELHCKPVPTLFYVVKFVYICMCVHMSLFIYIPEWQRKLHTYLFHVMQMYVYLHVYTCVCPWMNWVSMRTLFACEVLLYVIHMFLYLNGTGSPYAPRMGNGAPIFKNLYILYTFCVYVFACICVGLRFNFLCVYVHSCVYMHKVNFQECMYK
jgi:hypothetical protein